MAVSTRIQIHVMARRYVGDSETLLHLRMKVKRELVIVAVVVGHYARVQVRARNQLRRENL